MLVDVPEQLEVVSIRDDDIRAPNGSRGLVYRASLGR